jgi:hypothetical protein
MNNLELLNQIIYMQNIVNNAHGRNLYNNNKRDNEDIPPMPDNWCLSPESWRKFAIENNITKDNVNDLEIKSEYVIKDGFGREIKRFDPEDIASEDIGKPKNKENVKEMLKDVTDAVTELDPRAKDIEKSDPKITINQPLKVHTETDEFGNQRAILKDLDGDDYEVTDSGFIKLEKEEKKDKAKVDNQPVDVEKLLSALDKIANKLLDYEYFEAKNILDLKEYITSDYRIIKGTHLNKRSINQLIYRIDILINDAEDYLDANELMILYFGIYLARIKNKEIRNKGARKVVNTILHPPVQDLI